LPKLRLLWSGKLVLGRAPPQIAWANYTTSPTTCAPCDSLVLHLAKCKNAVLELVSYVKFWFSINQK
jgi:hypothetical protein